uniref:N-acetyltransferase domain-containing protein n=1 Tax=Strongyloides venezuelensis TaxID=75913 RepID=A0A0K0FCH0_STRVS
MGENNSLEYDFRFINEKDEDELVEFLVNEFLLTEPMNNALKMSKEMKEPKLKKLFKNNFLINNSFIAFSKEDGKIVGIRLLSKIKRDEKEEEMTSENELSPGQKKINKILHSVGEDLWNLVPENINTLVRTEISCVARDWYRKGIASKLEDEGNKIIKNRFPEVQGIVAEASSNANQTLLKNKGYKVLKKSYFCDFDIPRGYEGTDHIELVVKLF